MLFWWAINSANKLFQCFGGISLLLYLRNGVTNKGVGVDSMPGDAPDVMPVDVRFLLTVAALSALSCFLQRLINERGHCLLLRIVQAVDRRKVMYRTQV